MPSSILINDGRRSASPDRRVTFGTIERYDIRTSNQIKNNMNQKRDFEAPVAINDYPMTRLDNRIRKALLLGFSSMPGNLWDIILFSFKYRLDIYYSDGDLPNSALLI